MVEKGRRSCAAEAPGTSARGAMYWRLLGRWNEVLSGRRTGTVDAVATATAVAAAAADAGGLEGWRMATAVETKRRPARESLCDGMRRPAPRGVTERGRMTQPAGGHGRLRVLRWQGLRGTSLVGVKAKRQKYPRGYSATAEHPGNRASREASSSIRGCLQLQHHAQLNTTSSEPLHTSSSLRSRTPPARRARRHMCRLFGHCFGGKLESAVVSPRLDSPSQKQGRDNNTTSKVPWRGLSSPSNPFSSRSVGRDGVWAAAPCFWSVGVGRNASRRSTSSRPCSSACCGVLWFLTTDRTSSLAPCCAFLSRPGLPIVPTL